MKVASYEIVFQEVPGEVTLALNISGCPNRCKGCHSPHLWEDTGEELTPELLESLIDKYAHGITCVCFMGGDQDPEYVAQLAQLVQSRGYKTAWYSGRDWNLEADANPSTFHFSPFNFHLSPFTFIKTGPYIEALGGLKSPTTNQRFYKRENNTWLDQTALFRRK